VTLNKSPIVKSTMILLFVTFWATLQVSIIHLAAFARKHDVSRAINNTKRHPINLIFGQKSKCRFYQHSTCVEIAAKNGKISLLRKAQVDENDADDRFRTDSEI